MSATTPLRSIVRLLAVTTAIAIFAACDRAPTSPEPAARAGSLRVPTRDLSDSTQCLSGFIVINGIVVCQ